MVTVRIEEELLDIPPPEFSAMLPEKVQLVSVELESELFIPPPKVALLPEKVQLVSVRIVEELLYIPPPGNSISVHYRNTGDVHWFCSSNIKDPARIISTHSKILCPPVL